MEAKPADLLLCDSLILWVSGAAKRGRTVALLPVPSLCVRGSFVGEAAAAAILSAFAGPSQGGRRRRGLPQEQPVPVGKGRSWQRGGARRGRSGAVRGHLLASRRRCGGEGRGLGRRRDEACRESPLGG